MKVRASSEAASFIQERGGSLYLWTQDFGRNRKTDKTATEAPPGIDFDLVSTREFRLYVEQGLERPPETRIELRRLPPTRLKISWGDRTWGARGQATNGG
jgi:hypothetical protein